MLSSEEAAGLWRRSPALPSSARRLWPSDFPSQTSVFSAIRGQHTLPPTVVKTDVKVSVLWKVLHTSQRKIVQSLDTFHLIRKILQRPPGAEFSGCLTGVTKRSKQCPSPCPANRQTSRIPPVPSPRLGAGHPASRKSEAVPGLREHAVCAEGRHHKCGKFTQGKVQSGPRVCNWGSGKAYLKE